MYTKTVFNEKSFKGKMWLSLIAILFLCITLIGCNLKEFKEQYESLNIENNKLELNVIGYFEKISSLTSSYNKKEIADELANLIREEEKIMKKYENLKPSKELQENYDEFLKLLNEKNELYKEFEISIREDNNFTMEAILNDMIKNTKEMTKISNEISNELSN